MHAVAALRPLSTGEILDGAFILYRRHFRVLVVGSTLTSLPALLAGAAEPLAPAFLVVGVAWVSAVFSGALSTWMMAAAHTSGSQPNLFAGLRAVGSRLGSLLVTFTLYSLLWLAGTLLLIVPGVLVATRYFAVMPAAVLERSGWREARRRSRALVSGAEWQVGAIVHVAMLLYFLPYFTVWLVSAEALPGPTLVALVEGVWAILATPLVYGIYVILYYDRRVRSEALDVQLAAERLEPAMAGAM